MSAERWRHVAGIPGYLVSNHGRVASYRGSEVRQLQGWLCDGYPRYRLVGPDGERYDIRGHRLVLEAFVGPCPEGMEGCHNDGNKLNNRLDNLRWDTDSENNFDQVRHGTHVQARKTACKRGHPFDEFNTFVKRNGARECRTCMRARCRDYKIRKQMRAAGIAA